MVLRARQAKNEAEDATQPTVLEVVLRSDARRLQLESESQGGWRSSTCTDLQSSHSRPFMTADLAVVLDKGDLDGIKQVLAAIELNRARVALEEAQRTAIKRSGARGADARKALIAAERVYEERKATHDRRESLCVSCYHATRPTFADSSTATTGTRRLATG